MRVPCSPVGKASRIRHLCFRANTSPARSTTMKSTTTKLTGSSLTLTSTPARTLAPATSSKAIIDPQHKLSRSGTATPYMRVYAAGRRTVLHSTSSFDGDLKVGCVQKVPGLARPISLRALHNRSAGAGISIHEASAAAKDPSLCLIFNIRRVPTTLKQEGGRLVSHSSLLGAAEVSLRHLQLTGSGAHLPARPGPPAHLTPSPPGPLLAPVNILPKDTPSAS